MRLILQITLILLAAFLAFAVEIPNSPASIQEAYEITSIGFTALRLSFCYICKQLCPHIGKQNEAGALREFLNDLPEEFLALVAVVRPKLVGNLALCNHPKGQSGPNKYAFDFNSISFERTSMEGN